MTIEITYCRKWSTNNISSRDVESVQVKPKGTRFDPTVKKAEIYNRDIDNDLYISKVTKIKPCGFKWSVCLTHNGLGKIPRQVMHCKETSPIRGSIWDNIYCINNTDLFNNDSDIDTFLEENLNDK